MNREKIKGVITPILTPMKEDGSIHEEELRRQIHRQLAGGVHGIFTAGTNGEGYILSGEEKERILEIAIEEVQGRVPVYAGTGCISVITPSFAQASQEELYEHYRAVAAAVEIPVVLYNIPARTGNALAPDTVKRLSQVDNIAGVKDSSGNFDNMLQYIEGTREKDFAVLSGNDSLILWNLLAGGTGGIAGCANVYPGNMKDIYEHFMAGRLEEARHCQDKIRSFRRCFCYGNPNTVVKTAVALLGHAVGKCRKPFDYLPEEGGRT